jgi:hypothetical protein
MSLYCVDIGFWSVAISVQYVLSYAASIYRDSSGSDEYL